jgi:hypothetical protein
VKVRIEFDMDNAAFEDDLNGALQFIFAQAHRKIHEQLERKEALCKAPEAADKLLDLNGNTVGSIELLKPPDTSCRWCGAPGGH